MKASERIRQEIEEQIRCGGLLPGDPVDEPRLMGQFGVSRTPVREALLQLKSQGLLTSLPRGGIVVAKMDLQQLFAMWELLGELESLCARYACQRMSNDQRKALARVHEAAEAVVVRDDEEGWQAANLAFHELLYEGSRNPYLRQEILRMRVRTRAYRRHAFSAVGQLRTSHHHHGLILKAILAHDCPGAAKAALAHLCPGEGARGVTELIMNLPKELLAEQARPSARPQLRAASATSRSPILRKPDDASHEDDNAPVSNRKDDRRQGRTDRLDHLQ